MSETENHFSNIMAKRDNASAYSTQQNDQPIRRLTQVCSFRGLTDIKGNNTPGEADNKVCESLAHKRKWFREVLAYRGNYRGKYLLFNMSDGIFNRSWKLRGGNSSGRKQGHYTRAYGLLNPGEGERVGKRRNFP